jgi:flagellar hook protein FlgE
MPSFSIPLTGLQADTTALNTIANNLANMNTTAYKSQKAIFSDFFYQQVGTSGCGDAEQVGVGTQISAIPTNFASVGFTATGSAMDMALNGNGFFVLDNQGVQEYCRAGNFTLDSNGNLKTQDGLSVMGYPAVNGVINSNAALVPINIPENQVQRPQATKEISMNANLDPAAADGTVAPPATISVYDSLGVAHSATVTFTRNVANGGWDYAISLPAAEYSGATANTTGTCKFDASGNLVSPAANVSGISFTSLSDGASDLNFTWNLYDSTNNGTISQVAAANGSSVNSVDSDGHASGEYKSFSVDSSGVISVQFDNGKLSPVGQLAVATVTNQQGLLHLGSGNYAVTLASGQASLGVAGTGGRATIQGDALESSNVDISTEFSNLIVTQRAYEANSKAITTFDTISQETINMIR